MQFTFKVNLAHKMESAI